jgi:hypothetical protein
VDVAATVDVARNNLSMTIVNRGEQQDDLVITLRDFVFDGNATLQTLTTAATPSPPPVPGVEAVALDKRLEEATGPTVRVSVPAKSFTALQARIALS